QQPIKIRFSTYYQAMDLMAKAIQIAELRCEEPLIKEMHQVASRLILESYLAIETFQAKLERARSEGKPDEVKNLLLSLDKLKTFCHSEEDRTIIAGFYKKAEDVFVKIPVEQQGRYREHREIVRKGLTDPFKLPSIYPTQKYQQGLKDFRAA